MPTEPRPPVSRRKLGLFGVVALVGAGLIVATGVTLFIVPLIYSLLRRKPPTKHQLDERFEAELAEPYSLEGSHT